MGRSLVHPHREALSRRSFLGLAGLAAAGLVSGCTPLARFRRPAPRPFPTAGWPTSTPEEQGIDSQAIADMLEEIARSSPYVHSFLLVRHGVLVTEAYFDPITRDLPHYLYSATKSVTSALVGIAIQDGFIRGVDQKIVEFFPEMLAKNSNEHLRQLSVEHLLTMSTGHVANISPSPYQPPPVDWVEKFLADKTNTLMDEPGMTFLYTSGAPHTLSAAIQKTTGRTTADYAAEKLFAPLGIHDFAWLPDQNGINYGNSWLRLKPLDMAKLGYLYLNEGAWDGKQVVPQSWVKESTRKHIDTKTAMFNASEKDGYGYFWWMNGFGGYSAHGFGGQFIFVIPDSDLVAVFTAGFDDARFDTAYRLMRDFVLPAVHPASETPSENNPAAGRLAALLDQAARPAKKPVSSLPAIAARVSGKPFQFEDGSRLTIFFDNSPEFTLHVDFPASINQPAVYPDYRGGLDGAYRLNPGADSVLGPTTIAIKGDWTDETTFVEVGFPTDNVAATIYTTHFSDDRMVIDITDNFSGSSTYHSQVEAVLVK